MQEEAATTRRHGEAGQDREPLREQVFAALRAECAAAPAAPGFLARFRNRRDARREQGVEAARWRFLALRLAPAAVMTAAVATASTLGVFDTSSAAPAMEADEQVVEYADPFAAGLEEAGVATVAVSEDEPGYELVAVLYEPLGTR